MAHNQGIQGKNVVAKSVKTGVGARGVNVKWPAQVGGARANRVQGGSEGGVGKTLSRSGIIADPYKPPNFNPVRQGNELAATCRTGPGGGRDVYRTGVQGQHGPVAGARRPPGRSFDD